MGQLERENEELKIENSKLKEEMSTNHRAKMAKLENQLALMGDTKSTKVKSFHVKCLQINVSGTFGSGSSVVKPTARVES